jgi:hypothetical protein
MWTTRNCTQRTSRFWKNKLELLELGNLYCIFYYELLDINFINLIFIIVEFENQDNFRAILKYRYHGDTFLNNILEEEKGYKYIHQRSKIKLFVFTQIAKTYCVFIKLQI